VRQPVGGRRLHGARARPQPPARQRGQSAARGGGLGHQLVPRHKVNDMLIALVSFVLFLLLGMPVVFVLGLTGATAIVFGSDIPVTLISERIFSGLNSFTIMAIPFFVFAGAIMEGGGLSRRIVDFAMALIGWVTGSLYLVAITAATALAAISGSGSADAAAVSSIMQPEFKRRKYDADFAAAVIASSSSLAQIIPPSLLL